MGFILSKFRRSKPATKDLLENIDKELRSIQRFQVDTELQQKKIIGRIIIFSAVGYVLSAFLLYFLTPRGLAWKDQLINVAPFIVFPMLMFGVKRFVAWYYQQKIVKKRERYAELKKEKQRILEDVMDNETFKVGKEILEKYAPSQLLPKHLSDQFQLQQTMSPSPVNPGVGQRLAAFGTTPTQAGFNEGLRRRQQQGGRPSMGGVGSTAVMSTPLRQQQRPQLQLLQQSHQQQLQQQQQQQLQQQQASRAGYTNRQDLYQYQGRFGPKQPYLRQSTNSINRPVLALTASPTPYSPQSVRFRSSVPPNPSYMLPLAPANPIVHNRPMGWMDKLVEYVIGDGPNTRFALICRYCATHNGLATAEEFPYLGFRCVFCKQFNPPKQVRPSAPKLPTNTVLIEELESTVKSSETTDSEAEKDNSNNKNNNSREGSPVSGSSRLQIEGRTDADGDDEGESDKIKLEEINENTDAQVELATDEEDQQRPDSLTSKLSTEDLDQDIDENNPTTAPGSGSGSEPELIDLNQTEGLHHILKNDVSLEPMEVDLGDTTPSSPSDILEKLRLSENNGGSSINLKDQPQN